MDSRLINCDLTEQLTTDYAAMTSQQMIVATLNLFCGEGVVEIRCLDADGRKKRTDSGYFDNFTKAAACVQTYVHDGSTKGVYFVLNECQPELLARAANRIEQWATTTTSDAAILSRRWLYVDCDPVRPSGISSTNEQVQQAIERAANVADWLMSHGLSEPITAMSGNGSHLHFPVDLPNDAESLALVAGILGTLKTEFSDDAVSIDTTVSNAARICRLYGTNARKGDSTADRPHRMAGLLHVPDYIRRQTGEVCDVDALRAVAAMNEAAKPIARHVGASASVAAVASSTRSRVLVDTYLQDNGIEFKIEHDGAVTKYMMECPFNPEHERAYIGQFDTGAVFFKCSHNSCVNNNWQAVKNKIGKPDGDHYDPPKRDRRERMPVRPTSADGQEPQEPGDRSYDATDLNDIGNAHHFATKYENDLRYCAAWKKWLIWDGCRWRLDDEGRPLKLAKELVHTMFGDAMELRGGEVFKHVCETAQLSRLNAMVTLAATELPIRLNELDQDVWLLNCKNGTLDLKTGELKPHDRTQGITKLCPTAFDINAEAPVWNKFLRDVFIDDDLIQFVQRLFGYFLTGDVSEQRLPLFYGTGANGKSTLLNAFMETVGSDFAMQCMPDFLMEKKHEGHPTEKAALFGKRLVSCTETEASRKLAESTVKMLTGGERIMARRMKEDFWEFDPTHKIVLSTNHRPIIEGTDHGIWRRLLLVPFLQRFDGERQDKQLPDKLKVERAGILAWAVRGCLEWQRIGLDPPASVTGATADYRSSEDIFGRFMADCCVVGKPFGLRFSDLYARFSMWANDTGDSLPNKKAVGIWLDDNGFGKYSANGRCYRGLMIRETNAVESL